LSRQQGILPEELVKLPLEHFNDPSLSKRIQEKRAAHYETKRRERLRIVEEAFRRVCEDTHDLKAKKAVKQSKKDQGDSACTFLRALTAHSLLSSTLSTCRVDAGSGRAARTGENTTVTLFVMYAYCGSCHEPQAAAVRA
jgi:hypothetical protein